jgi:hypothetical protein
MSKWRGDQKVELEKSEMVMKFWLEDIMSK